MPNVILKSSLLSRKTVSYTHLDVYKRQHALSFFSVFNNDAIQQVSLYKSYFPLKYGGRTSSVIDVKMREGNNQEKHRSEMCIRDSDLDDRKGKESVNFYSWA